MQKKIRNRQVCCALKRNLLHRCSWYWYCRNQYFCEHHCVFCACGPSFYVLIQIVLYRIDCFCSQLGRVFQLVLISELWNCKFHCTYSFELWLFGHTFQRWLCPPRRHMFFLHSLIGTVFCSIVGNKILLYSISVPKTQQNVFCR